MSKKRGETEYELVATIRGGEFLASGKVVHYLKTYLARGKRDRAGPSVSSP